METSTIIYTISSVVVVSFVSLIGILTIILTQEKTNKLLLSFVSISAGTLFGGAFLHLIPEAVEKAGSFNVTISLSILGGIVLFFLIDKLIHWKHSHSKLSLVHEAEENNKSIAYLNLFGDGIHNFLDGLVIAGSYLVGIPTGIAVTIAVVAHEIPQELADFGVLLYSGLSKGKALIFNSLSALTAIIGAVVGLILGTRSEMFTSTIIPFAAGAFIYIAGSNLIPELLDKEYKMNQLIKQLFMFILGILIMYCLLFLK